ncbi:hypothetical protein JCM8115_001194 [Rhodotorula mucilaginosa]|uniref:U3-containing 90S pre-ribosomal complex subunit-domain containing protein n=1 Tax=Rhodotorula mucilaginosa TaxID=5537 RepID=A0A9P6VW52_RHOMI|nr:hypothetical protein C6P46_000835 [Rhodotorula mucilaginosa]TKA50376.1 hypothetical protein B0A53_06273 [Rhodotorula sp. CCFEE 5036]
MAPASKKAKMSHAAPADVTPTGDDLDDNFVLDDEFAGSASDLETEQVGAGEAAILSDDAGAAYESSDEATPRGGTAKKRGAASDSGDEEPTAAAPTSKRAAKKANQRKKAKVADLGLEDKTHDDMGLLPVEALADRLAEKQRAALPNLSALELDEQRISQSMILDTSSVTERDSLLAFMKQALPTQCNTLAKMPKATGSPRIIVIAGAALRVADLCRDVKSFKMKTKDGLIDVGKLFAKHFKLSEHVEYLGKTHVGLAVGTPNRIEKLLNETEAFHLTHLSHLILDVSHLDSKKRSLVDLLEARADLFKLLGSKPIMDRLREGKMKLVVF